MAEGTCFVPTLERHRGSIPEVFHVAILAGGRSSRMGRDKKFLELDGEKILDRVLRVASSWAALHSGRVILCGAVPGYPCVADRFPGFGPLAGLDSALFELNPELIVPGTWILLMPVDMPRVDHRLLDFLCNRGREKFLDAPNVDAIHFGGFEMPCLLKATAKLQRILSEILAHYDAADRSIRRLLESLETIRIPLGEEYLSCMENLNTPEDLRRLRGER